ncbi:MAG: hypothetical protein MJ077_12210 [Oscillospiraceae bacterium]|nr:hypothetical protein [Oscillospiraceae bacterium]
MIMISDVTLNNVTEREIPSWMKADNYDVLMGHTHNDTNIFDRLHNFLRFGK